MGKLARDISIDIFIKFILELMIHRIYLFLSLVLAKATRRILFEIVK